ncbi:MAG: hypothetical protein H8E46_02115 [FCB group bacterium]|nr:hypothetical protein [FCB group bacterium]
MPSQIKRLLIFLLIFGSVFFIGRKFFVPASFGELGHYRALAVDEIIGQKMNFSGHQACFECHDDISETKQNSYHKPVNCEACHGPALEHAVSEGDILPLIPRGRGDCLLCHGYNPARPTGFPQIDASAHNPNQPCIKCHNPHAPDPSETPDKCSACHNSISRTKALSPHAILECSECHLTPAEHHLQPRKHSAGRPESRSDCLKCHERKAAVDKFMPKVDESSHGEAYLCWQCHYPHFPESK